MPKMARRRRLQAEASQIKTPVASEVPHSLDRVHPNSRHKNYSTAFAKLTKLDDRFRMRGFVVAWHFGEGLRYVPMIVLTEESMRHAVGLASLGYYVTN
jgi:hypothetical protein